MNQACRVSWLKYIILYFYQWGVCGGGESGYAAAARVPELAHGIMEWAVWVDRSRGRAWLTGPDTTVT